MTRPFAARRLVLGGAGIALVLTGGALLYPWLTVDPRAGELALAGVAAVVLGSRLYDASRR